MTERATLSDLKKLDPEALVALIVAQQEQITAQQEQLLSRDTEIEHLKLLIAKLRRMKFGRSSEKLDRQIEQLELRLEELQTSQAENKGGHVAAKQSTLESPASVPARRPLSEHLPRETRKYLPKHKQCPDCGGTLKQLAVLSDRRSSRRTS